MDYNENDKKDSDILNGFGEDNTDSNKQSTYTTYSETESNVYYQETPSKANGLAIASLVLGILSIPCCCCYGIPSFIFSIIGLIFGLSSKKGESKYSGIAIGGLVCSIIGLVFSIIVIIIVVNISAAGGFEQFMDQIYEMLEDSSTKTTYNIITNVFHK